MESKPLPFNPYGNPHFDLSRKKTPHIVRPTHQKLLGGKLIIEEDQFIGIETTEDICIPDDRTELGKFLSGKRIPYLDNTKGDIQLLLNQLFDPELNYYFAHSGGIKSKYLHPYEWIVSDTCIEFRPCPCTSESCPWKDHKQSGWMEQVRDPYEKITGTRLGSPAKSLPSPQEIEALFKTQDTLCRQEGIYVKYFNRAGRIIGDILMQNGVGVWSAKDIDHPDLWTEYMNLADEAVPPPLTLAKSFGISCNINLDDRDGAHPSDLGKCIKISPGTHNIAVYNQPSQDDLLEMAKDASEIIAVGTLIPGKMGEPSHIRQETPGGIKGIIPTYRLHDTILNKISLLHEIGTGGTFIPSRVLVITRKKGVKDTTYKAISDALYWYKKTIPLMGWAVKAVGGKLGAFSWNRHHHALLSDDSNNSSSYFPLKWVPDSMDTNSEATDLALSAIFDPGLRAQLLSHTAVRLRQEVNSIIPRTLEYNPDAVAYSGDKIPRRGGFGEFRPENSPGSETLILNDILVAYQGDNHKDPILDILKDTLGSSKEIKGEKQLIRKGLEVYKIHSPDIAHQQQGQLYEVSPVYPVGTNKLLGPDLTVDQLRKDLTKPSLFRYAFTDAEIKEILEGGHGY